jgi:hypothetical protein
LLLPSGLKCTNRIYPQELESHWPHFSWTDSQHLQKRRSQCCLGRAIFSCVPKCTYCCKESDFKILCLPPHIKRSTTSPQNCVQTIQEKLSSRNNKIHAQQC